jgi:hypothetical protein
VSSAAVLACGLFISAPTRADESSLDPVVGYNYDEVEIARHVATAGAQRALSSSVGALFVNPANVASGRVYHIAAFAQIWPEAKRQSYGAAAADSIGSSSNLAGAAGATYNFQDSDGVDRRWTDFRAALAYPFTDKLLFGIGGRYLMLKQNGLGPLGASAASGGTPGEQIVRSFSFDAGATVKPVPEVSLAIVGTSLENPDDGFLPTTLGGGIGFGKKEIAIDVDIVSDFSSYESTTVRAMVGLELLLANRYLLRGGYRYDQGADSHAGAAGAGYVDRAFSIDIGVRRVVSGDTATAVVLGFTYHLDSTGLTPSAGDTF